MNSEETRAHAPGASRQRPEGHTVGEVRGRAPCINMTTINVYGSGNSIALPACSASAKQVNVQLVTHGSLPKQASAGAAFDEGKPRHGIAMAVSKSKPLPRPRKRRVAMDSGARMSIYGMPLSSDTEDSRPTHWPYPRSYAAVRIMLVVILRGEDKTLKLFLPDLCVPGPTSSRGHLPVDLCSQQTRESDAEMDSSASHALVAATSSDDDDDHEHESPERHDC